MIEQPQRGKQRSYDVWQAERDGKPTWWSLIRSDVDTVIRQSMTYTQFVRHLRELGYEIKPGKHLAIRPEGKERFVRLKTLGEDYAEEAIKRRILKQQRPEGIFKPFHPAATRAKYIGNLKRRKSSVKGLRALYLHYVYLLRRAQRQPTQKVSFRLREDVRKMDDIIAQTKLLCKYRIDTKEQLETFIDRGEAEKVRLVGRRKTINNRKRRVTDVAALAGYREQLSDITCQLATVRMEIKIANAVLARTHDIHDRQIDYQRQNEGKSRHSISWIH